MTDMTRRNVTITLDYVHGMTYEAVAAKFGIHTSRAHQVVSGVLKRLDMDQRTPPELVGLEVTRYLSRWWDYSRRMDPNSPEGFYWEELLPNRCSAQYGSSSQRLDQGW